MCLFLSVYDAISLFRNSWEQKHRVSDTYYINNYHANFIKFMKVTSNSTLFKKSRNTKNEFPKRIGRKCRLL